MLRIRRLPIDTFPDNTAFILRQSDGYSAEQFQALRKIRVQGTGCDILATLALVDDERIIGDGEIGLGEQAFRRLGLPEGAEVTIAQARPPGSLEFVRRKIDGDTLNESELAAVIRDIAAHRYSPMEISAFLVACAGFMSTQETLALTRAMVESGNHLNWNAPLVVDKHCIGGIPNNRTSMIIVPIVAAHGLTCPKTSSRAITSPCGTADVMEVLASVDLSAEQMADIVARENAVLAWGGRMNLSPADDVLISVERPLRLDTFEQMVASILSKKVAAGSTHLVIDIPVGPTAKVRSQNDAVRLRKLFEYVARHMGMETKIVFTDGSQPIGRGVGPVLEARDVMAVLRNEPDAPEDLRDHALALAGHMLDFDPELAGGRGYSRALELLASGEALATMERLIDAQGRNPEKPKVGRFRHEVKADKAGRVSAIDCERIARIARYAGAPMDQGAGIDLLHKNGSPVHAGDTLYRIYANSETGLGFARDFAAENSGYSIA
ncbi:thymidine phosphorylase family protein [Aurantiacibacter sp. MUD11]|uniref:thymidine phosphorylase family protein n=1 Tax=Aurantiacibacter sp. MUD11 TaxID=3003265 RepID=UPI0022AA0EC1|nr:thymidine phosphorylase family protein [Aurantiacibacter sp. MUD11]WAT19281.1 thymidine phosphorylase family protein [Aurantiacibacter sp. MUD11]